MTIPLGGFGITLLFPFMAQFCMAPNMLGPVYTITFSNENGTKSCRFGLPFTLKRFRNRNKMKTILKTEWIENGMKRFSVNAGKRNDIVTNSKRDKGITCLPFNQ